MKKNYVVGFAFNPEKNKVLLIEKNRPEWQAGKLNGIGGKIENFDQTINHAMSREFIEETGIDTEITDWKLFSHIESLHFNLYCFTAIINNLEQYQSITDEIVHYVDLEWLYNTKFQQCITNLAWLIPMAMDDEIILSKTHYN